MSSRGTTTKSRPLKSLQALYARRLIGRAANSCLYRDMALPHLSDALMLSRRGLVFTRDHIERLRLERILPDFLLHERIRRVCIDIFNTGHHQAAVFEAFRELEVRSGRLPTLRQTRMANP